MNTYSMTTSVLLTAMVSLTLFCEEKDRTEVKPIVLFCSSGAVSPVTILAEQFTQTGRVERSIIVESAQALTIAQGEKARAGKVSLFFQETNPTQEDLRRIQQQYGITPRLCRVAGKHRRSPEGEGWQIYVIYHSDENSVFVVDLLRFMYSEAAQVTIEGAGYSRLNDDEIRTEMKVISQDVGDKSRSP